ncbi:MAG: ABC transporter, partial [Betaproteobacteria bacterium]
MITINKQLRMRLLIQNGLFVLLLLLLVGLLGYLGREYNVQWDISQNGRNTLNQASAEILQKMDGPVTVTVYVTVQDARLGDIRKIISEFLRLYQRIKPDFTFTFIDPTEHPKVTQEAGIKVNGEMVVTFNGRSEHLTIVNEQVFTNLLIRLVR